MRYTGRKRRNAGRKRCGFSLIETVACLVILSMLMVIIGRLAMVRVGDSLGIDAQYAVLSADGWLSDIYRDFHSAQDITYETFATGEVQLGFLLPDGSKNLYSFSKETGWCYTNGIEQFKATRFEVVGAGNNINIDLKLPNERLLTLSLYI